MERMSLNVLLSLIIQAKIKGKGNVSNERVYVKFVSVIADFNEKKFLTNFTNDIVRKEAYRKLGRFLSRFLKDGKGYPYMGIQFTEFESCIGNSTKYTEYLRKMKNVCDEIIDKNKVNSLVFTLLEIMRHDGNTKAILYGSEFVEKDKFLGSYAHPKRICIEALLLGLLYYVHKNPAQSKNMELLKLPEKRTFQIVHFNEYNSLNLELPINLIENIHESTKHQKSENLKYNLEFKCNDEIIYQIPKNKNVFLYGTGGVGKTTVLLNQIKNEDTINFYFPLYSYKVELRENLRFGSCWILLNILLKYHYQYEYQTYESCSASEGEETVLQQLTELENSLKISPINTPKYRLLLDGINEMPFDLQRNFFGELEWICREWKNVSIVVTSRTVSDNDFADFEKVEICGVTDKDLQSTLSDFSTILLDKNLVEIFKLPIFLNMYKENLQLGTLLNTKGELIDKYIKYKIKFLSDTEKFIVRYVIPFVAGSMFTIWFNRSISRAEVVEAVDSAIKFYLMNDNVFQSYVATKNLDKNTLRQSRAKEDWIRIMLNTGFLEVDSSYPRLLHFTHQYYQDYFAARHIVNLIEVAYIMYDRFSFSRKLPKAIMQSGLFDVWYGGFNCVESDEVYRFIGEICGDYKNITSENFSYHGTLLDELLEMSRDFHGYRTTENVIRTMKFSRNNTICGVDFSELKLPPFMCSDVDFIDCNFKECTVPPWISLDNVSFKNCDFSRATFWREETKKLLADLGATI